MGAHPSVPKKNELKIEKLIDACIARIKIFLKRETFLKYKKKKKKTHHPRKKINKKPLW